MRELPGCLTYHSLRITRYARGPLMSSEESAVVVTGNAYGRVFRERGTVKIVLAALILAGLWYAYDTFQTNRIMSVNWPPLQASKTGLIVLGLLDHGVNGRPPKYIAI